MTFAGTDRYTIQRQLGSGGFGVVYQAYDRARKERVALKVLRHIDPTRLFAFKREFRALADVAHPNLVSLYELTSHAEDWFFTMELIEGDGFLEYVRGPAAPPSLRPGHTGATVMLAGAAALQEIDATSEVELPVRVEVRAPPVALDDDRLRSAFAQLVEGVRALHRSGQLHRDLKPSNALVTRSGRVVLLDFGLVKDLGPDGSVDRRVVGTVPYMSPEQATGARLTPASDWYALGVMMYRALTGALPHVGDLYAVLVAKRTIDPLPPRSFGDVPLDLDELCMALLSRDPRGRPDGDEILRRLGVSAPASTPLQRPAGRALVGRDGELEELQRAFDDVQRGELCCVALSGPPGIGKTALMAAFVERMRSRHAAVVLQGICYERESVPYKALDSLMDALSSYLCRLPRLRAEQLMPREVRALARLFPVLDRVESVAGFPARAGEVAELSELRRRAIAALAEMLGRMRDHAPLLLCIDDAHWGDADSARLLRDLLDACPPVLVVLAHRSDAPGPFVEGLRGRERREWRDVELCPLEATDAQRMAMQLLDTEAEHPSDLAAAIAREGAGNPFLIDELVRHVSEIGAESVSSGLGVSLGEVLRQRVERLSEASRSLLRVMAIAGKPIPEAAAAAAAGLDADARSAALELRGARLARMAWAAGASTVAVAHDRIRDAALAELDATALAALHGEIAEALAALPDADAEALAEHFVAAGQAERARRHATTAAEQALFALAFARAARLFQHALELGAPGAAERARLHEKLAEALAHVGRGPEAARAYLDAASADSRSAVRLRCRAAEQLFFCGHLDAGTDVLHEVLEAARLPPLPRSEGSAIFGFLRRRLELKLRGLDFRVQKQGVDPAELVRTDVCYSVSAVLGGVRPLTASTMQTHHLLMALELGEPYRIVRGLGLEAVFTAMGGRERSARTADLLDRAAVLAGRIEQPEGKAFAMAALGICAYFEGNWQRCRDTLIEAEVLLSERCAGLTFELGQVRSFLSLAMFYMGEVAEAGRRVLPVLKDARERGDRYVESMLVMVTYRHFLLLDDVATAREEIAVGLSGWYRGQATVQDFYERTAQVRVALYSADGTRAWALLDDSYRKMARSALMRVQIIRCELRQLRAQAALCAARHRSHGKEKWLSIAEAEGRRLASEDAPWCRPIAELTLAAVAHGRGSRAEARERLARAERQADAERMAGFAAAARFRRAQLGDGDVASAEAWMREQGIVSPEGFANLHAPGF